MSSAVVDSRGWKRHPKFYFDDGSVILLVESTLFRIHKTFLQRQSEVFRDMFTLSTPGVVEEGRSDESPIHLKDDKSEDWERFLSVMHPDHYEVEPPFQTCTSTLRIARKYEFTSLQKKAILGLLRCAPAIDKVLLGHEFNSKELLYRGFKEICKREDVLTLEEGSRLAHQNEHVVEDLIHIAQARQQMNGRSDKDWYFNYAFEKFIGDGSTCVVLCEEDKKVWKDETSTLI